MGETRPADGLGWLREAEAAVGAAVLSTPEQCMKLALGDHYGVLRPTDGIEHIGEALDDVRRARLDERLRMVEESRRVELEERLRLFSSEERVLHEEQHRLAHAARAMRRRARTQLAKEAEASRWLEQQKFEADKKYIIDHERSLLMRRRRDYEATVQMSSAPEEHSPDRATLSPHGDVVGGVGQLNNVVLVMTVAIGDNKEDVITVRERDDHYALARAFAARHRLPEQVIEPLVREIQRNLSSQVAPTVPQGYEGKARSREPVFDRLYPDSLRSAEAARLAG